MVFYFVQDRRKGVSGTGYYLRGGKYESAGQAADVQICDCVYSLFAAGLRLCLVQRTAGASGKNGIQGYLDKLYGAFCAAVYGECHCLCL